VTRAIAVGALALVLAPAALALPARTSFTPSDPLSPRQYYLAQDHAPAEKAVRRIFAELVDERGMDAEAATDYLAGMTDRFALAYAAELD